MLEQRGSSSLLPNLRSFDLTSDQWRHNRGHWDCRYWVELLGSDKIKTVVLRSKAPPNWDFVIGYEQASSIVYALASHCPNIQKLSLYPRHAYNVGPFSMDLGLFISPWYKGIQNLNKLKSLSVSDGWLSDNTILGLGNLPELTTLEFVYGDFHTGTEQPGSSSGVELNELLSPTAFPKLGTLTLDIELVDQIYALQLQKMVKHVNDLELSVSLFINSLESGDPEFIDRDFEESKELFQHEFLPLFANMPNLKDLKLTMCSPHSHIDKTLPVEFPGFVDAISLPQLDFIGLVGVHFGSRALERNLGSIWPQLTSLALPDQDASLQELASFATIPNLSHLLVRLKFATKYPLKPISRTKYAPLKILESSEGAEISSESEVIDHTVRYVLPCVISICMIHTNNNTH